MNIVAREERGPARFSMPARFAVTGLLAGVVLAISACTQETARPPATPRAEFLLAAGDSTYWIQSGPEGVRVRSAPILLTESAGHFYEVFIADDVTDYSDASFATARAFRRDIAQKDSLLIYDDSTVLREAVAWQRAHPGAVAVDPDEIESDDPPPTFVADDIEVADVHGPWLTFGYSLNVDVEGRKAHLHKRRRGVLDIRDGNRASLTTLFGATEAERLRQSGQQAFALLQDSVRRSVDARGAVARKALHSFVFDSMSFGLTDVSGQPAVTFEITGTAENGEALSMFLPSLKTAVPSWWPAVSVTLPHWSADSSRLVWSRGKYDVIAGEAANAQVLFLSLADRPLKGTGHSWPIAAVPEPAYQLIPLDAPAIDSATRAALSRAFDQSSAIDGAARQARWTKPHTKPLTITTVSARSTTPLRVPGFLRCPMVRTHARRMFTQPSAFRASDATSSACSRLHLAFRFRVP